MKKINGLVLSALTAAFLVGCGGGGSSSSSASTSGGTTTPALTSTDVTVERGPVYGATVTDANGQVATQKTGTNVYTFATTPKYPITASGGIIDVDGNGPDEGDIELTTPLMSYSNVITPITDYLGDITTDSGKAKLAKFRELTGITSDDDFLKKVPSESTTEVLVLTNALFDLMNDGDSTNDDFISNYETSYFKTRFDGLKTEAENYKDKDKKELEKALEDNVITNQTAHLTILKTEDLANTTTSTTLKVADLTRWVSYEKGNDSYDDVNISDNKITIKSYVNNDSWINDQTDEVVFTKDATNPYKFSYVDSITKEEGTFTILSTKKVAGYSDLSVSKAQTVITKQATEFVWEKWGWENPYYWDNQENQIFITNVDDLEKYFADGNWTEFDGTSVYFNADGTLSQEGSSKKASIESVSTSGTTNVGTWKKDGDYIVATVGKLVRYFHVVKVGDTYDIEESDADAVGYVHTEVMYTGTSLDELVTNIKAPAPIFGSEYFLMVNENQTSVVTPSVQDNLKVTFSLSEGYDYSLFNIDSTTGTVTFKDAPDYESMTHLPSYAFIVEAKNSAGKISDKYFRVNVMDVNENPVIPTPPVPTPPSFISGMNISATGTIASLTTFTFNADGTYYESFDGGNCSGLWKDFGNNKIGVTCEPDGTTAIPASEVDVFTNILQFNSDAPSDGDNFTVTDPNGSDQMTIVPAPLD